MNGPHDLGGKHGFGSVHHEWNEPIFHADWERRVLALTLAMGATGSWTIDQSRHARECLDPAFYLSSSYYHIWIAALETLLDAHGLTSEAERRSGGVSERPAKLARILTAGEVATKLSKNVPYTRRETTTARFNVDDRITTRLDSPPGHTRLPSYAAGRPAVIHAVRDVHVFADSNARGDGEDPRWLYNVRFEAADLWGPDTTADHVHLDLWEPYLEPA